MQNHEWYIIANPAAGKGKVNRKLPLIERLFRKHGIDFELVKTTRSKEATSLFLKGIHLGFRKILAIGGDGTNNEVVNGIMQLNETERHELTYALLSIGTGNDWIRTHNIPVNIRQFIKVLKNEKTTYQDIGVVHYSRDGNIQKRYFANIAGMAYDAFIVKKTENLSGIFASKLFYLTSLLRYLFQYKLQKADIQSDDRKLSGYFYTINAGICRFAGGGMEILPHAVPDDGQLAITVAGEFSKAEIIWNMYRFYNGTIAKHPKIQTFHSKKLRVESLEKEPVSVEADGEFLGYTPVEFGIIPKALKILVP